MDHKGHMNHIGHMNNKCNMGDMCHTGYMNNKCNMGDMSHMGCPPANTNCPLFVNLINRSNGGMLDLKDAANVLVNTNNYLPPLLPPEPLSLPPQTDFQEQLQLDNM
jgi:hypothetical protein